MPTVQLRDDNDAARDDGLWKAHDLSEGEFTENFNDVAEFVQSAHEAGDEDGAPSWTQRLETVRGHMPRRGKGYGYRRDRDEGSAWLATRSAY